MNSDAVFIHTQWRTGKTALWSLFRSSPEFLCYYEPLHETLLTLDHYSANGPPNPVHDSLNHPRTRAPTFGEFRNLIGRLGGVGGFDHRFVYERFFTDPDAEDANQRAYLTRLIDNAEAEKRRPVLAFSRSTLSAGWMVKQFGGTHIAIVRHPHAQWASYRRLAKAGNDYFLAATVLAFVRSFGDQIDSRTELHRFDLVNTDLRVARLAAAACDVKDLYFIFYVMWLAGARHSSAWSDVTIELNFASRHARGELDQWLTEQRCRIDLGHLQAGSEGAGPSYSETVEAEACAWLEGHASVRHWSEWLCSSEEWRFVGSDVARRIRERGHIEDLGARATERARRIVSAFDKAVYGLFEFERPGQPITEAGELESSYRWVASQLRLANGCEVRPGGASRMAVGCARSRAFASLWTTAFSPPPGRNGVSVEVAAESGPVVAAMGVRVVGFGGAAVKALEFVDAECGPEARWLSLAEFETGGDEGPIAVTVLWRDKTLCVRQCAVRMLEGKMPDPAEALPPAGETAPAIIDCAVEGNSQGFLGRGFHGGEHNGRWTSAGRADMKVPGATERGCWTRMTIGLRGIVHEVLRPSSRVTVYMDGARAGEVTLISEKRVDLECTRPPPQSGEGNEAVWVSVCVDDVVSPFNLGRNDDRRLLGVRLFDLKLS